MDANYRAVFTFKWWTVSMSSLGQLQKWHWWNANFLKKKKIHFLLIYLWSYKAYTSNHKKFQQHYSVEV